MTIPNNPSKDKLEFVRLGWQMLEAKARYYNYTQIGDVMSDEEYDKKEQRYIQLSKKLGLKPTVYETVGFPFNTASGRLVLTKINEVYRNSKTVK